MLGTALLDAADDVDAAVRELRLAVELDPTSAEMQVDLSRALMAKGKYESAVHHLHKALELDPTAAALIYTNLGSCRASAGHYEEAVGDLEKAVAAESAGEAVLYSASLTLASVYRHLNRTAAALEALERCSSLQPDAVLPHLRAAEVMEQAKSYVAALNRAAKAQELAIAQGEEAHASDAARLLGSLSEKLGNGDAALQHYERALQAEPDSVPLLVYIGSLLEEQARAAGSTETAGMEYLERACQLDSMNASANNALAVALGRLRRFSEGRERAERAVVLASREVRKATAAMDVERARSLLANTHSNAGYLSRECGALGAAISHFEASLKLQPDSGDSDTWNKLGQAYAQKKLVARALECFRRASEADPSDARVHYNAAAINANLVATRQGIERAINHAKRAVELDRDFEEAQSMLVALTEHKAKKGW
jgi:tetratricopeptide (TPR) repeat protein